MANGSSTDLIDETRKGTISFIKCGGFCLTMKPGQLSSLPHDGLHVDRYTGLDIKRIGLFTHPLVLRGWLTDAAYRQYHMTQTGRMRRLIIQTLRQDRIRSRLLKQTHIIFLFHKCGTCNEILFKLCMRWYRLRCFMSRSRPCI